MVLEACAFSFIYNFVLYRRLYITRKDYQDHNHCLCKCSQIIKSWKLLCSKYRLKVSLFYLFFHCGKFLNLENVCRTGHGSCIFPGRYETRFLSLITLYFFFVYSLAVHASFCAARRWETEHKRWWIQPKSPGVKPPQGVSQEASALVLWFL